MKSVNEGIVLSIIILISANNLNSQGNWTYFTRKNTRNYPHRIDLIFEDNNSNIWISSGQFGNIHMFNGSQWTEYTIASGLINPTITTISQDSDGTVWIGTMHGISAFQDGILKPRQGTYNGRFPTGYISCIYEDTKGNIWFGTGRAKTNQKVDLFGGSLVQYNMNNNSILHHDRKHFKKLPIHKIGEDKCGNIWVAWGKIDRYYMLYSGNLSKLENNEWISYLDTILYAGNWFIDDIHEDS